MDVHQLVESVSHYLQKAIIIETKNFELIAYSSPNAFSFDPIQQKTILTKRCPLYVIERLKKEGVVEQLAQNARPIRLHRMEDIDFYERVVIRLKHLDYIYGYLWIYETEWMTEEDMDFLMEIAPHLAKCIYKQAYVQENTTHTFMWKLINDEFLNEAEVIQAAKMVSYQLPEEFTVLVYSVKDARFVYVLEKIKVLFSKHNISFYLGKGTEIVGIIQGNERQQSMNRTEDFIHRISTMLTKDENSALYAGIGGSYNRVNDIRKSYLEALEVIETMVFLNVKEQDLFHFRSLGLYRYVKSMYKKNVSEQYRNNEIMELMFIDLGNNSELVKTLWSFLQNDCKVGQTADALYIHPNTLNYRMKQITYVTKINFSNMEEKMELYTQLMLIHLVPDYWDYYMQEVVHYPQF